MRKFNENYAVKPFELCRQTIWMFLHINLFRGSVGYALRHRCRNTSL